MECNFCHQDVAEPCKDTEMVHARAIEHVERCEEAEKEEGVGGEGGVITPVVPPITHQ